MLLRGGQRPSWLCSCLATCPGVRQRQRLVPVVRLPLFGAVRTQFPGAFHLAPVGAASLRSKATPPGVRHSPVCFVFVFPSRFSRLSRVKCQGRRKQRRICVSVRRRPRHVAVHFERVIVLSSDQFDTAESAGQSPGIMIYLGEWEF